MRNASAMSKDVRAVLVAYKRVAPLYDLMNQAYFLGRDKLFRSMLAERLTLRPGDVVLDLCCGTGVDFPFLLEKIGVQGNLSGLDLSFEMLQQAKKKIESERADLVNADAAYLPFRDRTYDGVFVSFCLKVTPSHEKCIEEASRVLKPNGKMGILANDKPRGRLRLPGIMLTKVLSAMAKIDFEVNLREHVSRKFIIVEDRKMHGGLVQFLVAEKLK